MNTATHTHTGAETMTATELLTISWCYNNINITTTTIILAMSVVESIARAGTPEAILIAAGRQAIEHDAEGRHATAKLLDQIAHWADCAIQGEHWATA